MFPPAIVIIPTSLAVAYSIGKYINKKNDESPRDILSNPSQTFCKYNVLLRNLPLYYWMFPSAIDRLPKLSNIGGGGERWVVRTLSLV